MLAKPGMPIAKQVQVLLLCCRFVVSACATDASAEHACA